MADDGEIPRKLNDEFNDDDLFASAIEVHFYFLASLGYCKCVFWSIIWSLKIMVGSLCPRAESAPIAIMGIRKNIN